MSTTDQPTPPLTRKQMREIRNTGSNVVITADVEAEPHVDATPEAASEVAAETAPQPEVAPDTADEHEAAPDAADEHVAEPESAPEPAPTPPWGASAPLARAAEPVVVPDPPVPDAAVDLGVSPLTRRQARQQERIRTASVPVITPEIAAAYSAAATAPPSATGASPVSADDRPDSELRDLFGLPATGEVEVVDEADTDAWAASGQETATAVLIEETDAGGSHEPQPETADEDGAEAASERAIVNPMFGAELLAGEPAAVDLPPSFDQLLARSAGTGGTPHALIMSQGTQGGPIVAPVTATGEVLITGTLNLPEGLGSNGHAPGATDGKEVDASLVDGEIPAHSSPTPIAASAAISTVKNSAEIIRPPAPEKGSKLMMTLAITAGVLALALVGVLILAFVTGVF